MSFVCLCRFKQWFRVFIETNFIIKKTMYKMAQRISFVFDPKDVADFNAATATQTRIALKWITESGIDVKNLPSGTYMGTLDNWLYCQDGFVFATEQPKIYDPEELDAVAYKNEIDCASVIIPSKNEIEKVQSWLSILFNVIGKNLMAKTNYIRKRGNDKRDLNHEYATHSDKLNVLFEKRAEKSDETRKNKEMIKDLQDQLANAKKPTV